jgi:4-hydroxythreonine-4-phosphate dehydrogenase
MNNLIAIIAGEPDSINCEIIAKAWRKKCKNIFIIGNYSLIEKQFFRLGVKISLLKIKKFKDLERGKKLPILNVPLKYSSIFKLNSLEVRNYIFKCFNLAHKLAINKKIFGFINAPVDKNIFNNKFLGVTEYLANKNKCKNKEVMFIHNKNLSVVPLTTHVELKNVTSKITISLIRSKVFLLFPAFVGNKLNGEICKIFNLGLFCYPMFGNVLSPLDYVLMRNHNFEHPNF